MGKMFHDSKAVRLFSDLSDSLEGELKVKFTDEVKKLFEKKISSDDGAYDTYYITVGDLLKLGTNFGHRAGLVPKNISVRESK